MDYQFLQLEQQNQVATVWINRAELHNAFNTQVIEELHACFQSLNQRNDVRVVILAGRGKSFSAGADLNWMKRASGFTEEENRADARKFAGMLRALSDMSKPTVARVQGAALGGGTGLAAACDMAVASLDAQFATSEVKFGIIPAVISPYVLRAIGPRHALRYFQSGERFSAQRALEMGLVTEVCEREQLDATIAQLIETLIGGAPLAQKAAKDLIAAVDGHPINDDISEETAQRIARQRATSEAKDGIAAFLEKRTPAWLL